jgi:flagellum-specific peptidoglycan hydrolase FlgJ
MRPTNYILTTLTLLISMAAFAQKKDSSAVVTYIKQYKDIAIDEMKRAAIPASITLAQGIHESSFGTSYLAKNTNNHFGINARKPGPEKLLNTQTMLQMNAFAYMTK